MQVKGQESRILGDNNRTGGNKDGGREGKGSIGMANT